MILGKIKNERRERKNVVFRCMAGIGMAILSVTFFLVNPVNAQAAQSYTVQGKVRTNTTSSMLYLSTSAGNMEIKIDSSTDTTNCKVLFPDNTVTVECYGGFDGYLHASKLSNGKSSGPVTINSNNPTTVQGTVASNTTDDLLYLSTSGGTMQIKLDTTTDLSGCKVLTLNKNVTVKCGGGSDGYLHALSISDVASSVTTTTFNGQTATVLSGTVQDKTTTSLLKLSTAGGNMEIVLDIATDISKCKVLTPGQNVSVAVYRGSDAYMHAAQVVDNSNPVSTSTATVNTNAAVSVTGTVASGTNSQTLYLSTSGGTMQIKMDTSTTMSNGILMIGRSIKVSCAGASDGYLHAISISAN